MPRVKRLTPEAKLRLKKLASYATCGNLGERFGISQRQVERILSECPDCEYCGNAAPLGATVCQRCVEKEVSDGIGRKGYI